MEKGGLIPHALWRSVPVSDTEYTGSLTGCFSLDFASCQLSLVSFLSASLPIVPLTAVKSCICIDAAMQDWRILHAQLFEWRLRTISTPIAVHESGNQFPSGVSAAYAQRALHYNSCTVMSREKLLKSNY